VPTADADAKLAVSTKFLQDKQVSRDIFELRQRRKGPRKQKKCAAWAGAFDDVAGAKEGRSGGACTARKNARAITGRLERERRCGAATT